MRKGEDHLLARLNDEIGAVFQSSGFQIDEGAEHGVFRVRVDQGDVEPRQTQRQGEVDRHDCSRMILGLADKGDDLRLVGVVDQRLEMRGDGVDFAFIL